MRIALTLLLFVSLGIACKKSNNCEGSNRDCSDTMCIAFWSYFEFKLTDKTTGADLVFGPNPKYTTSDIKLYYDAARTFSIGVLVDNSNRFLVMDAHEEMYLEIKGTDIYKLTAEFRDESCCSRRVKTLWRDGQMVCSCCPDAISLSIK